MKLSDIKIFFDETFGEVLVVSDGMEVYSYVDGKKTDKIDAIGYRALGTKNWEPFLLKVREKIPSLKYNGTPIPVKLTGIDAKLWMDYKSNEVKVSVTVESVEPITSGSRLKLNKGEA
ncbi:MAG: hypothetical protein Q4C58_08620 [Eubacteriales bacterium]|nr:hypothetical protein [Eubacteriales bacterium]